jgi:hypothetical protein
MGGTGFRIVMKTPVLWESVGLSLICMVDAFWTVLMVKQHLAVEANPVMIYFLSKGVLAFVAFKVISLVPGIFAAEYVKFKNRRFASLVVRAGLVGYLLFYVLGDLHLNHVI